MIYCITLIIIVALLCATRIYPLWLRHDCKRTRKALELVRKVREENALLRKDLNEAYDGWFGHLTDKDKTVSDILDQLYELSTKLDHTTQ